MGGTDSRQTPGFALHEVVVALAVLGVALLGLAATLTAAISHLGAARARDVTLRAAGAVAATARVDMAYSAAPSRVGEPGQDGLPGTADDVAVDSAPCIRRVREVAAADPGWFWVEAACGPGVGALLTQSRWSRTADIVVAGLLVRR